MITQEASVVDLDERELWFHSTLVPVNGSSTLNKKSFQLKEQPNRKFKSIVLKFFPSSKLLKFFYLKKTLMEKSAAKT